MLYQIKTKSSIISIICYATCTRGLYLLIELKPLPLSDKKKIKLNTIKSISK